MSFLLYTAAAALLTIIIHGSPLVNVGFEEPFGWDSWWCSGCEAIQSSDAYSGNFSFLSSQRTKSWSGVRQYRLVENGAVIGQHYFISAYVKLVSSDAVSEPSGQKFTITFVYKYSDNSYSDVRPFIATDISLQDGWIHLAVDYTIEDLKPELDLTQLMLYIEGPEPGVEFLTDDFTMEAINHDSNWREAAEQRIDESRYKNLTVKLRFGGGHSGWQGASLELHQLEGSFGFGSSVDAFLLSHAQKYRDTFLQSFNWGTLDYDMSWQRTEFSKNRLTWEDADAGMSVLEKNGKRVRGATVHSADKNTMPGFVQDLESPEDIYRSSMKRVDDLIGRYRYRCDSWDVYNGLSSKNNRMTEVFGSKQIIYDLFKRAKEVDYAAELYLSEKDILTSPQNTQIFINNIQQLQKSGSPLDGIGVSVDLDSQPDIPNLLFRLDRLAETGLPVWITGYSDVNTNETARAQTLNDILTMSLSCPNVEGIMLSGFWDRHHSAGDEAALFTTDEFGNIQPNAVGMKWLEYYRKYAKRDEVIATFDSVAGDTLTYNVRAANGIYNVVTRRPDGSVHRTVKVSLLKHLPDKEITIWI